MDIATDAPTRTSPGRLDAKLFSIDGKRFVALTAVDALGADASVEAPPAAGSIAVVVRNGIRICGTVAAVDGERFHLDFERPIDPREQELFVGAGQGTVTTTLPTC